MSGPTPIRPGRPAAGRRLSGPIDLRLLLAAIPVLAVLPLLLIAAGLLTVLSQTRTSEVGRERMEVAQMLALALDCQPVSPALSDRLSALAAPHGALALLLDADGRVVGRGAEASGALVLPSTEVLARVRSAPAGAFGPGEPAHSEGASGAWAALPNGGGTVLLWQVASARLQPVGPLRTLAILGGLLLVASAAAGVLVARRIIVLVDQAGQAAREVAAARRPDLPEPGIRQFAVLFGALADASERVTDALERERGARAAAEASEQRKDRFLVLLGHELRNPLNAVGNAGHLLRRRDLSDGQRDGVVDMLLRQTRQLRRLVDDLLDLGRILAGKFTLRREPVSLDRLLRQSIATLGATGQLVGHVLRADLEPISCDLDPARIEQVFINLLNNAIKYTPEGGSIQVSLARRGDAAELRVADTGIGIPPDQIERVFELFVQAEPADGRAASGLGVGLSMARLLVEAHGGTIRARSEGRGCGTEMIVRIPCDAAPRPDGPAPRPA